MLMIKVTVRFTEPILGTLAGDPDIAIGHIASKHPQGIPAEDETEAIENLDEQIERSATVFPRTKEGVPFIWDYQWKGFFKEAAWTLANTGEYTKEQLKLAKLTEYQHKRTIDKLVFVTPRRVLLNPAGEPEWLQRPIRAQTLRGPRICLGISETFPAGTTCEFAVECLNDNLYAWVRRWLDYGSKGGTLQWRSGGYGRFEWSE